MIVLLMTGYFNIRDSLWNPSFLFHSSISDDLIIIADSFNLTLLSPITSCPTRYFDIAGEVNSIIDLIFLCWESTKLNQRSIHPKSCLSSDHAPLSINIPISKEVVCTLKLSIPQKSKQEAVFVEEVISNLKNLDMSNIADTEKLDCIVNQFGAIVNQA